MTKLNKHLLGLALLASCFTAALSVYGGIEQEKLSVSYAGADTRRVLLDVAKFSDLQLVLPDTLSGTTNIKLRDVSWRRIFDVVLQPEGYDFIERDGAVHVLRKEELDQLPNERRTIELDFQTPMETKVFLEKIFGEKVAVTAAATAIEVAVHPRLASRVFRQISELDHPDVRLNRFPRRPHFPSILPDELLRVEDAVTSLDEQEMLQTAIIVLKWVDGAEVRAVIIRHCPSIAGVTIDSWNNLLVITGTAQQQRSAAAIANYLDDKRWYRSQEEVQNPGAHVTCE